MEDSRLPGARLAVAHGNPPQIPRPEPVSGSHPTAGGWAVMSAVCREEVRNPGRGDTGRRYGAPLGGAPLGAEWCVAAGGDSHCTRCGGRGDRTHSTDLVRVASEAADGGEESSLMDSRKATRLVTCSRGRQAGAFAPGALRSPGSQSRLGVHGGGRLGPPKGWCFITTESSQVHRCPRSGSAERRGRPARAFSEPPGSIASGHGASCERVRPPYKLLRES